MYRLTVDNFNTIRTRPLFDMPQHSYQSVLQLYHSQEKTQTQTLVLKQISKLKGPTNHKVTIKHKYDHFQLTNCNTEKQA